jgi:hypothetical protein
MLKEKKYQMRLRDLYSTLSHNQVLILPDPRVKCNDGIPLFSIFTKDFREKKRYKKLINAFAVSS